MDPCELHAGTRRHRSWARTTSRQARSTNVPLRTSARTCCFVSTTAPRTRAGSAAPRRRRRRTTHRGSRAECVDHRRVHLPRLEGARSAAGLSRQLHAEFRRGWRRARRTRRRRGEQPRELGQPLGSSACTCRRGGAVPGSRAAPERGREGTPRAARYRRRRGDLASGLLSAPNRANIVRLQGRHRTAGSRGQRHTPTNSKEKPLKAGEIILGYPDETGELPPMPTPEILGRNGTYVVFRKLHTRVAAYRQYLRANAASRAEEALLGAKMVGRWQSGAPLALSPERDDPDRADPRRNNDSSMPKMRAASSVQSAPTRDGRIPRDALDSDGSVDARLHRMIRRGPSYGPCAGRRAQLRWRRPGHLRLRRRASRSPVRVRQSQWLNDGIFIGSPLEKDPLVGTNEHGSSTFTIPQRDPGSPAPRRAAIRDHPRRRVLLRPRPLRARCAGSRSSSREAGSIEKRRTTWNRFDRD